MHHRISLALAGALLLALSLVVPAPRAALAEDVEVSVTSTAIPVLLTAHSSALPETQPEPEPPNHEAANPQLVDKGDTWILLRENSEMEWRAVLHPGSLPVTQATVDLSRTPLLLASALGVWQTGALLENLQPKTTYSIQGREVSTGLESPYPATITTWAVPSAPTMEAIGPGWIRLANTSGDGVSAPVIEWRADDGPWQSSPYFDGLAHGPHRFFARVRGGTIPSDPLVIVIPAADDVEGTTTAPTYASDNTQPVSTVTGKAPMTGDDRDGRAVLALAGVAALVIAAALLLRSRKEVSRGG